MSEPRNETSCSATAQRLLPWTESLLAKAQRRTKLSDLGSSSYVRFLDNALRDVEEHGDLTRFGRFGFSENVVRSAATRLKLVELVGRHPEIEGIPLEAPVFITGLYRSGTTLLHRLLASSSDFRAPLFWEMRGIGSDDSPAKKLRAGRWSRRIHRLISPGFEDAHEILADDPEECFHLFENCAPTSPFWMTAAQKCAWWMIAEEQKRDMVAAYQFLALQLRVLAWRNPEPGERGGADRLLLKWPFHLWNLESLFEVFPDATVLVCRRDLDEEGFTRTVASTCSLAWHGLRPFCGTIDKHRLGRFWWDFSKAGVERAEEQRQASKDRIIDVPFGDLVKDPQGVAEGLCAELDVGLPEPAAVPRLQARRRKHVYRAEDFGIR